MKSYDYAHRKGVRPISWEDFVEMSGGIAQQLEQAGIDIVIGIARAGLLPATLVACSLRKELFPVRVTRRVNDAVTYNKPQWKVPVSNEVAGKGVAIVDEIADTGETLEIVRARVMELGALRVVTACLISHSWAEPRPDIIGATTDEFVIFPWDQRVLVNGVWGPHPEIVSGLEAQQPAE